VTDLKPCAYLHHEGPKYLPLDQFRMRMERGRMRPDPYCRDCRKAYQRSLMKQPKHKAKKLEWARKNDRWSKYTEEQKERRREAQRIRYHLKTLDKPKYPKKGEHLLKSKAAKDPTLPSQPVVDLIHQELEKGHSLTGIADRIGVDARRLRTLMAGYEIKNGKKSQYKSVTLSFADKVLVALDASESLEDLYPDLAA
jgi:hypothetical protein